MFLYGYGFSGHYNAFLISAAQYRAVRNTNRPRAEIDKPAGRSYRSNVNQESRLHSAISAGEAFFREASQKKK